MLVLRAVEARNELREVLEGALEVLREVLEGALEVLRALVREEEAGELRCAGAEVRGRDPEEVLSRVVAVG